MLSRIPLGEIPNNVNVIIEIPQGSSIKYEVDKESGVIAVDRFLHTSMVFPFNYGYIPNTLSEDGDPVDVLVLASEPVLPGCFIPSRIIGVMMMEDNAGMDEKIIAVPKKSIDPWYAKIEDVSDIDEATIKLIHHFFEHYKSLEPGKWVKVGEVKGKDEAIRIVDEAAKRVV